MYRRLAWTTALLIAFGAAACGDDDDKVTFADLDQSEQISNFTTAEYEAFCKWAANTDTMMLSEPFVHLSTVDACLELDRPDCELSLYVDCVESEDASSTQCSDYKSCTATTYEPENRPCESNPTECPNDGLLRACNHVRYTNGAWVVTTGEPVYLCNRKEFNFPCLCEIKNAGTLSCPFDDPHYDWKATEGNCVWNPQPPPPGVTY